MRSKAPLTMMEQVVMLLVFALAAALCLQAFAAADQGSRDTEARDRAAVWAQSAAETLKHTGGDWEETARLLDGTCQDDTITVSGEDSLLVIASQESEHPYLGRAEVRVEDGEGEVRFTLPVAWQTGGAP